MQKLRRIRKFNLSKSVTFRLNKLKAVIYWRLGKAIMNDSVYLQSRESTAAEHAKLPSRTEVINYLLTTMGRETKYLEIGVRNPDDNFNKIRASKKFSVDPCYEFDTEDIDFKMTSDEFFSRLDSNSIFPEGTKFDIIFIDGLHLAEQVDCDISNSLRYIADDGFIVLHDCNPPTEWHARETYSYWYTPARGAWNGTTWKAFYKWRFNPNVYSCCIDSDFGVGILSKSIKLGQVCSLNNEYFEYSVLDQNRQSMLNLMSYEKFVEVVLENH